MGYLHLYYDDYLVENNSNPYLIIEQTKQKIKQRALSQMKIPLGSSAEREQEFEEMYGIKPEQFSDKGDMNPDAILDRERWKAVNMDMASFDDAIAAMQDGYENHTEGIDILQEAQKAVNSIDAVLRKGAATAGLTDGAMEEARQWKKTLQQLKWALADGTAEGDIAQQIKNIATHASGALLEIAFPYAFLTASEKGLEGCNSQMLNIGGHTGPRISTTFKEDPQYRIDVQKVRAALKTNSKQSKADSVIHVGEDGVSGTITWAGFQQKNYQDISSIEVMEFNLDGLLNDYDTDFVVNTAGSLGYNHKQDIPMSPSSLNPVFTQGAIDAIWMNLKRSVRLNMAAEGIAGLVTANFTNKVNYYVIRSKKNGGQVRVIGVSTILQKILDDFNSGLDSSMGISFKDDYDTKAWHRERYWIHNVDHFQEGFPSEVKYVRSMNAYPEILQEIRNTKMQITLNFSYYFQ